MRLNRVETVKSLRLYVSGNGFRRALHVTRTLALPGDMEPLQLLGDKAMKSFNSGFKKPNMCGAGQAWK